MSDDNQYYRPGNLYTIHYNQLDATRQALLTAKFGFESLANSSILHDLHDIFARYAKQASDAYDGITYEKLRENELNKQK
jgi:hypothetical protein